MDFSGSNLEPSKAAAQVVVTEELLRDTGPAAEAAFGRELRGAVADAVDQKFFDLIGQSLPPISATADPYADAEVALDNVNLTGSGRLYWVMQPQLANALATKVATNGNRLFPELSPTGGQLAGLPALVTNQLPAAAGSPIATALWLIDATVQMDTAPAGDAVAAVALGTPLVSLWQENLVALLAEVRFAAQRIRPNAVAVIEGAAW